MIRFQILLAVALLVTLTMVHAAPVDESLNRSLYRRGNELCGGAAALPGVLKEGSLKVAITSFRAIPAQHLQSYKEAIARAVSGCSCRNRKIKYARLQLSGIGAGMYSLRTLQLEIDPSPWESVRFLSFSHSATSDKVTYTQAQTVIAADSGTSVVSLTLKA